MYETIERRQLILNILCERRYETMDNLALEFSVHRNTIKKGNLKCKNKNNLVRTGLFFCLKDFFWG